MLGREEYFASVGEGVSWKPWRGVFKICFGISWSFLRMMRMVGEWKDVLIFIFISIPCLWISFSLSSCFGPNRPSSFPLN